MLYESPRKTNRHTAAFLERLRDVTGSSNDIRSPSQLTKFNNVDQILYNSNVAKLA